MLRLIAFICFVSAGAVAGNALSDKLKQNRENTREIHSMLIQISALIRYKALDVFEIVHELCISGNYKNLEFLQHLPDRYEPGTDFREQWVQEVTADRNLNDDERSLLLSFGSVLGTSDAEGQLMSVEAALETVRTLEVRRSEEYQQKGRLYRSLGMLFGTMAGIMII